MPGLNVGAPLRSFVSRVCRRTAGIALVATFFLESFVVAGDAHVTVEVRGGPVTSHRGRLPDGRSSIGVVPTVDDQSAFVVQFVRDTISDHLRKRGFVVTDPENAEFHLRFDFGTENKKDRYVHALSVTIVNPASSSERREVWKSKARLADKTARDPAAPFTMLGQLVKVAVGLYPGSVRGMGWTDVKVPIDVAGANYEAGMHAYERGDYPAALEFWVPSAEMGHPLAQYSVGGLYRQGEGVAQDNVRAAEWFSKAAQRLASAQYDLGYLYAQGAGVDRDLVRAYAWILLAGAHGHASADDALEALAKRMDAQQITAAEALSASLIREPSTGAPRCSPSSVFEESPGQLILEEGSRVSEDQASFPVLQPGSRSAPVYPELARVARLEARVIVQGVISKTGEVEDLCVVEVTRPNMGFEEAALAHVSGWKYEPARVNDQAVAVYFSASIDFQLQ